MRKKIKIGFWNFWDGFDTAGTFSKLLVPFLEPYYEFIDDEYPDFLVFSNTVRREMPAIRNQMADDVTTIFFDGEYLPHINPRAADYTFTCHHINYPTHWRLPYYMTRFLYTGTHPMALLKTPEARGGWNGHGHGWRPYIMGVTDPELIRREKTGFCNFIFSNPAHVREEFCQELNKYKSVNCAGARLNNMGYQLPGRSFSGGPYTEKLCFMFHYKFTIAFENDRGYEMNGDCKGYTTEKLTEPMLVGSIPLYWGNPLVDKDFNTKSFVNYFDFDNFSQMIEYIIELDNNDKMYEEMIEQPWYPDNKLTEYVDIDLLTARFREIFG